MIETIINLMGDCQAVRRRAEGIEASIKDGVGNGLYNRNRNGRIEIPGIFITDLSQLS